MASITIPLWSFIVLCVCAGIFILFTGLAKFSMVLDYIEEHKWQIRYKRYLKAKKKAFLVVFLISSVFGCFFNFKRFWFITNYLIWQKICFFNNSLKEKTQELNNYLNLSLF